MKQIRLLAALLMVALVVTSCITWVDDEGGNSGNSQGGKQLSRILEIMYGSLSMAFEYDNGKLVYSTDFWDSFYYTYSGKNVTVICKLYSNATVEWNLQLNNNGYVESAIAKNQNGVYYEEAELNFEYSNGYLTKYNYNYSLSDGDYQERVKHTYELKYDSNNNLSSLTMINNGKTSMIINYTPLNIPSKGKTYWILCDDGWLQDWDGGIDLFPFYFAGFLGKEPKNVISTCTINAIYTSGTREYYYSYTYLFDSDNYVKSMFSSSGDELTFIYE